jgi:hypothetical protein
VTDGSKVIGSPPLVLEVWYRAQVFQGAPNEVRPSPWVEQKTGLRHERIEEGIQFFLIHLITTTVEDIWDGLVTMGETLLLCCLCDEIMHAGMGWRSC